MRIGIIGTGYVGLVSGVCFARILNQDVTCIDIDENKISMLKKGKLPIYEVGLRKHMMNNTVGKLSFSTSYDDIADCELIFICVGTPPSEDGSTDLRYVISAAKNIGSSAKSDVYVVIKSTEPVGTDKTIRDEIQKEFDNRKVDYKIFISSNPEFLKEGSAVEDFINPSRIVIGTDDNESKVRLTNLYSTYLDKCFFTDVHSAQMIKYASNSFLATKISFVNSLVSYCEENNINLQDVIAGMKLDPRIGDQFLNPGPGYGGSCFPKDVNSLLYEMEKSSVLNYNGFPRFRYDTILRGVDRVNSNIQHWPFYKIAEEYCQNYKKLNFKKKDDIGDLTICILGSAFKPDTDDVRLSSTIVFIQDLVKIDENIKIKVYDPIANDNLKKELDKHIIKYNIEYSETSLEAIKDSDAVVLMTPWKEFLALNMNKVKCLMKGNTFIDTRAVYDYESMNKMFNYYCIGRTHKS